MSATESSGTLRFHGTEGAELFAREAAESLRGVLELSYVSKPNPDYPVGFIHASPPQSYWSGTCWPRDTGAFLRELVLWGCEEHAIRTATYLMDAVPKNGEGFHSFPEYFRGYHPRSAFEIEHGHEYHPATSDELDGTGAIVVALALLARRLGHGHPVRTRIREFLRSESSPLAFLHRQLGERPLLVGRGEFGGGNGRDAFCNVVQNYLCSLGLLAAATMEEEAGDRDAAAAWREDAQRIQDGMLRYLRDAEGCWLWCVDPRTMRPDPAVLGTLENKGFGGINAVACLYADVLGLLPEASSWNGIEACRRTFDRLLAWPPRRQQFERYGLWMQLDDPKVGLCSSPSYGSGYALQTMLLYDRLEMAGRVLEWLADATFNAEQRGVLFTNFPTGRMSPYYFYERCFSPDAVGVLDMLAGCGPLNLVNVAEPLKAARLVLGVDDVSADEVRIVPRLPPAWKAAEATDWPILTSAGSVRADIRFERSGAGCSLELSVRGGATIPRLAARLPRGAGFEWKRASGVRNLRLETP